MRRMVYALLVAASMGAACKQADGEMPARNGEVPQRLVDIGRDIDNVTGGNPDGPAELTDDLLVYAEEPEATTAARAMSTTISGMILKRPLNEETRNRLAMLLWTAVAARDLSERQIDTLKDDMRELLTSIGVSQEDANLAAGWVGNVQKAVTKRNRRWYERY
jgi:hypothetical protein